MKQIQHKDFELLPHTADLCLRVYGSTLEELFKNALIGMFQSIGPTAFGCQTIQGRLICKQLPIKRDVFVCASEKDQLLINFLNEVLYLCDIYDEAYLDMDILELSDTAIKTIIKGVVVTSFDVVEIKAVTHHGGSIQKINDCFMVDIVIDI